MVTRSYECRAPLAGADPEPLIATLQAQMDRVMHLHPALRGAKLEASDGFLVMTLRIVGRDRSSVLHKAKLVAGRLLHRAKLHIPSATLVLVGVHDAGDGRKSRTPNAPPP